MTKEKFIIVSLGDVSVFVTEAVAIHEGIKNTIQLKMENLIMESNSQIVIIPSLA